MREKLGLVNEEPEDESLIAQLLALMHSSASDFTNSFRALTNGRFSHLALTQQAEFPGWLERWLNRQQRQPGGRAAAEQLMREVNPALIPRNHRVEEALVAAVGGDLSVMERLLHALRTPYAETPDYADLSEPSGKHCRTFCGT